MPLLQCAAMPIYLLIASLVLFQGVGRPKTEPGAEGPPIAKAHEPTPFERFSEKLALDDKKQLPDVGKILSAASASGNAIGREMAQARIRLIELDGKPEAAPALEAFTASSAKMTALDAKTFQQVYALLDKSQQSKAPDAFLLTAGLLDLAAPRLGGNQRSLADIRPTRMELFTAVFALEGDQKKQVKTILDAEYKASSAARDAWTASRLAIGKAIQTGAAPADLDAAVAKHAADSAAMAAAEARAMAKIAAVLTPEQKAKAGAIPVAAQFMRLAFAGKKWDVSPE